MDTIETKEFEIDMLTACYLLEGYQYDEAVELAREEFKEIQRQETANDWEDR